MTKPDYLTETSTGVRVTLSRPIKIEGTEMATIDLREPLVNDQLVMDATKGTDAVKEIALFANLAGLKPADIQALSLRDYKRLQVAFGTFTD